MYTIVLIYINRDHQSKEQLFIIVLLQKTLNYVDIACYRNFCAILRALIKLTIVNFSAITEITKKEQLMYYDGYRAVVVYHSTFVLHQKALQ